MCTQLLSSGCAFQEGREVYLSHKNTAGAALAETARLQMTEDEANGSSSGSFISHCLSEPVAKPLLTLIVRSCNGREEGLCPKCLKAVGRGWGGCA